jgi:hypothetical protein
VFLLLLQTLIPHISSRKSNTALISREGGLLLGQPVRHETDIHNAHGFSRPRSGCASVAIKGRLWLLGGFSEKHGMLSSVISRDKKTPFWRVEPKMTCDVPPSLSPAPSVSLCPPCLPSPLSINLSLGPPRSGGVGANVKK